jgi:hypothetical protein
MKRKFARKSSLQTSVPGMITTCKPLADMTPEEGHMWIEGMRSRLIAKQQRERAYLKRRAARGTRTPTDEAYEADQALESELITLLDDLLQGFSI